MNAHAMTAYGLWPLVILNAGLFIPFAAGFLEPRTAQDWRTLGGFSAFVAALFAEIANGRIARNALAAGAGAPPTHGRTES